MSNRFYDVLVRVQRWLPALAAFYLGLSNVWGLPFGRESAETITLLSTLLAATVEVSSAVYYKER